MLRDKEVRPDGVVVERVAYELPHRNQDRPHGLKYRLYCGKDGHCIVRYDNEGGKGDHVHYGSEEHVYRFVSLEQLLADFDRDVKRLLGGMSDGQ